MTFDYSLALWLVTASLAVLAVWPLYDDANVDHGIVYGLPVVVNRGESSFCGSNTLAHVLVGMLVSAGAEPNIYMREPGVWGYLQAAFAWAAGMYKPDDGEP